MIRYIDGFDAQNKIEKYDYVPNFMQDRIVDGHVPPSSPNGGYAWRAENTAFSSFVLTRQFDYAGTPGWFIGFDLYLISYLPGFLARFENGPLVYPGHPAVQPLLPNLFNQFGVQLNSDGRLSFWNGGQGTSSSPGSSLGTTTNAIPLNAWRYVEISVTFATGGIVECYIDDALEFHNGPTYIGNPLQPGPVSYVTLYFPPNFFVGRTFDNLYIADNAPDPWGNPQERLGPCRVTTHYPVSDAQPPGWTRNGGASDYGRLIDVPSDHDTSYLEGESGQVDLFAINKTPCYGKVLAVGMNALGRDSVAGVPSQIQFLARTDLSGSGANQNVGNQQSFISRGGDPWYTVQQLSQASLANPSRVWNDGEISKAWWGLQSPGAKARVSQFYLEKLVSLRNAAFDCGQMGSYSF